MKRLRGGPSWLGLGLSRQPHNQPHPYRSKPLASAMVALSLGGLSMSCLPTLYQAAPAQLFAKHDKQPAGGTSVSAHMFHRAWQLQPCAKIVDTICVVKRMSWQWQALASGRYMHELAYYPHGAAGLVQPFKGAVRSEQQDTEGAADLPQLLNEAIFDERGVKFVFNGLHEVGAYDATGLAQFDQPASGRWFMNSYYSYPSEVMSAVMLEESFIFASHEVEPPQYLLKDQPQRPEPRYEAGDLAGSYAALIHYQVNHQVKGSQRYSYRAMFYPHHGSSAFRPQNVVAYMAGQTRAIKPQCGGTEFWSLCLLTQLTLYGDKDQRQIVFDSAEVGSYPYSFYRGSTDHLNVVFKDSKVYFLNQELGEGGYAAYAYSAKVDAALNQQRSTYFWGEDVSQNQRYNVFVRVERFYGAGRGGSRGHRCQYKGYFYVKDQPQNIVAYFRNTGSCCAKNHHQGHCSIAVSSEGDSSSS